MILPKIEKLIIKYINKSASVHDLEILSRLDRKPLNKKLFKDYTQTHYVINFNLNNLDSSAIENQLFKDIKKEKLIFYKTRISSAFKYAAIFIGMIGASYYFMTHTMDVETEKLIITNEDITLELDNGDIQIIDVKGKEVIVDNSGNEVGEQKGNVLDYNTNIKVEELVFNTLKVPYGKKIQIVLSDGTKVYLNAGSSLKYPVKFIEGNERKVFLNGEGFFDVTKDKEKSFIVNVDDLDVRVFGTKFNVSSYKEDKSINTVLVEGSVGIYKSNENYDKSKGGLLEPGDLGAWDKNSKNLSVNKVDTRLYTSWTEGELVFRNTPFEIIRKKLERHYNVTIINNNIELENRTYKAKFDIESIDQVLETLKRNYNIEYTINNNRIIIN